ncbi:MAG: flavin reductase family protein [Chitinophagaceae bacterium]|nr:flavin reductase family protein [Chitinophagaceae bacterium]
MFLNLSELTPLVKQNWMQHAIGPRPICFASTIDKDGKVNLSPFSFFNMVSSNPPVVIFSPSRRVRDNSTKHTLQNILEVPEVVINICDYDMVQQVSLASCEFPKGTDEFIKAGFTKEKASLVAPPLVKESKIRMECKVLEVKSLGDTGGAGQVVFAEVLCMHVDESILNDDRTMIDQTKLHHIARLGGDWYGRVGPENLFKVEKPNIKSGIGVDALPGTIRNSKILTGNNLGQLGNVHDLPVVDPSFEDEKLKNIFQYYSLSSEEMEKELHMYARQLLDEGNVTAAWQVLLSNEIA